MFRGDKNHKPGSEPIGKPIDFSLTEADKARIAADHVKQKIDPRDSIFTSWSSSATIARDKFAAGDPIATTKLKSKEMEDLEEQGQIRTYTPEQVGAMMKASGDLKLRKQADAVVQQMARNREILVEGVIPASMQCPMK